MQTELRRHQQRELGPIACWVAVAAVAFLAAPAAGFQTNQSASTVIGQPDMTSNAFNQGYGPVANSQYWPVRVHCRDNRLYLTDGSNHRILIYNTIPGSNNAPCEVVVGQANSYSAVAACAANRLNTPYSACTDGTKLIIADRNNNRVLIYNTIPTVNNANADVVVGQTDMVSNTANQGAGAGANTLHSPEDVYTDGTKLYVADRDNHRVLIYNTIPTANNASANVVVGQVNMAGSSINQGAPNPGANTLNSPAGLRVTGNKLFVADCFNHRVLIFDPVPTGNNASATVVIGQANFTSGAINQGGSAAANTLQAPTCLTSDGTRLFLADSDNQRVLIFQAIPSSNNASADAVLGQPDMTSTGWNQGGGPAANTLCFPKGIDLSGDLLVVGDNNNHRTLVYYDDSVPVAVYRSLGPGNTSALASGGSNALNIAAGTATFAGSLPDNVGVGDVIQYDSNNDGSVDTLAFIHGRTTASQFDVRAVDGWNAPPGTAAADQDWSVFRAYTSLENAIILSENTGIDASLRDFDVGDSGSGRDLPANNEIWHIAGYGDGEDQADITGVEIGVNGWTTSPTNYLRIYAPYLASEVGTSQRHSGVWNTSAYRLVGPNFHAITINHANIGGVRLEGLQIRINNLVFLNARTIYLGEYASNADLRVTQCLLQGKTTGTSADHQAIRVDNLGSSGGTVRIWNNIIYDFNVNNAEGIYCNNASATVYLYNNTLINCRIGYQQLAGTVVVKNCIAQSCPDGFNGTFAGASDYNISDLAADAPGANSQNSTTVTFAAPASYDFHLGAADATARDAGADLSADAALAFTEDIDRETRPYNGTWDIGADESVPSSATPTFTPTHTPTQTPTSTWTPTATPTFTPTPTPTPSAPTVIYRSVGPGNTAALADGSGGNTLALNGGTATFTSAPDNVGLGDIIQYDSDMNGSRDSLLVIYGRLGANQYLVRDIAGNAPSAVMGTTFWELFRAYISLADAETGTENTGIDAALRDFDTWSGGKDITATTGSNQIWNIACYADNADTTTVNFNGWTTGPDNYIRIFTPYQSSEVGTTQRHAGLWTTSGYRLEVANAVALNVNVDNLRVEGLQIAVTAVNSDGLQAVNIENTSVVDARVSYCLVRGVPTTAYQWHFGLAVFNAGTGVVRFWNNVIYDFNGNADAAGIDLDDADFTFYVFNNTIVNCNRGIQQYSGSAEIKNVLTQGCVDGYNGTFAGTSDYNLSDLAEAGMPGTHNQFSTTVTFVGAGGDDFHLAAADTGAKDVGTNLSGDANLPFSNDVDMATRGGTWDIGADEEGVGFIPTTTATPTSTPSPTPTATPTRTPTPTPTPNVPKAIYRSVGPGNTSALANGAGNNLSITGTTATFASGLPGNVGVGDAIQYDSDNNGSVDAIAFIHGRTSATQYTVANAAGGGHGGGGPGLGRVPCLYLALFCRGRDGEHGHRGGGAEFRHLVERAGSGGQQRGVEPGLLRGRDGHHGDDLPGLDDGRGQLPTRVHARHHGGSWNQPAAPGDVEQHGLPAGAKHGERNDPRAGGLFPGRRSANMGQRRDRRGSDLLHHRKPGGRRRYPPAGQHHARRGEFRLRFPLRGRTPLGGQRNLPGLEQHRL